MISAMEALERLQAGNRRYVDGSNDPKAKTDQARRNELVAGQAPFAVLLGCADSRVPAELVFDQGLGDLFVVRVAGNVPTPSQVGSIEFAVDRFGTRLVVVLGHTRCGAVRATYDDLTSPDACAIPAIRRLIGEIRPAFEGLMDNASADTEDDILARAVRANVRASAMFLREESNLLARLAKTTGLVVMGAEYSLETGLVDFFDLGHAGP